MYFYNKLEPMQTCESAIDSLEKEQARILKEIEKVNKWEDTIKACYRKNELAHTYFEYSRIIRGLEQVKEYVTEKMYEEFPYLEQITIFFRGL